MTSKGYSILRFTLEMNTTNNTTWNNKTELTTGPPSWDVFERVVQTTVPVIYGLITLLGLLGNLLVIIVIIMNKKMRSTTNILIFNLAMADLCFILFCVPFTAVEYAMTTWPFGRIWCKVVNFLTYVSAYVSVYTLVVMSLDRYLAVVHPLSSMSYRTQMNMVRILFALWGIVLGGHVPLLFQFDVVSYDYLGQHRSACLNKYISQNGVYASRLFYGSFFIFGYVIPLLLICILYGFILKILFYGEVPGGSQKAKRIRSNHRVAKKVVIVVIIFALCWLPIQIIFILQTFVLESLPLSLLVAQMISNCLAYINSCVNPILYAFLSKKFRQSFRNLLCCAYLD